MRRILLFISIFLAGCANSDFPFCCGQAGDKNVPYSTTYLFSFGTGFTPIVGANTFLGIVSQGDLNNLFNAANISRIPGTGTINGNVVSFSGGTVSNVVLEVTDLNGNKIGDLFYNSLGGIPDFSSTAGTSDNGGFTVLNTPPGEVYIRAVKGGRGNTVATSFLDSVSTISLPVRPIVPPFFGITGDVLGYPGNEKISGAILSPFGLKGLSVVSSGGRYRFPRLGSDSQFLIQGTASGYLPTYQEIATDLNSCIVPPPTFCTGANCAPPSIKLGPCNSGGVDLTQNLFFLSESVLADYIGKTRFLKQTGYSGLDPSAGILVGSTIDQDDTIR
ncbi:MAG: hypothetical protein HY266_00310, partial [Deltaproteobacteria bacterium]|nr:hypothetical protein [Deltaproteobacteria bacterium]